MHSGRFVFSQLMEHLPAKVFRRCVQRYRGDRRIQSFTCLDQFLCLAFAQLTHRESLHLSLCLKDRDQLRECPKPLKKRTEYPFRLIVRLCPRRRRSCLARPLDRCL